MAALALQIKIGHRFHRVAEKFHTDWVFFARCEQIEDAAAQRKLPDALDHITTRIAIFKQSRYKVLHFDVCPRFDGYGAAAQIFGRYRALHRGGNRARHHLHRARQKPRERLQAFLLVFVRTDFGGGIENELAFGVHRSRKPEGLQICNQFGCTCLIGQNNKCFFR